MVKLGEWGKVGGVGWVRVFVYEDVGGMVAVYKVCKDANILCFIFQQLQ